MNCEMAYRVWRFLMRTDANHKAWDNWLTWYFKILYNELK